MLREAVKLDLPEPQVDAAVEELRIGVLGDGGSGRRCVCYAFCEGYSIEEDALTWLNEESQRRTLLIAGKPRTLQVTHRTAPEGMQGAILLYNIASRVSFEEVRAIRDTLDASLPTVLVGNKKDLPEVKREVSAQEGLQMANDLGAPFFETSCTTGEGVWDAFEALVTLIDARQSKCSVF